MVRESVDRAGAQVNRIEVKTVNVSAWFWCSSSDLMISIGYPIFIFWILSFGYQVLVHMNDMFE